MADQFRGDALACDASNSQIHTPNLDRLAREGVRFRCAYSSTPTCTPARDALLTGMSPWNHGLLGYGKVADRYPVELPRSLKHAGYFTTVIGKGHYTPQRNIHGFDEALLDESGREESTDFRSDYRSWFWSVAPQANPDQTGLGWNDYRAAPYALPEELHPTTWTANTAVKFLQDYQRPQPFFLKVSFERPHSPYDPPQRWWKHYQDLPLPKAQVGAWAAIRYAPRSGPDHEIWHGDLGEAQVRTSRQGYCGSVSHVDEQIGRIVEALEKRGWLEETLIVFMADHGDMLGDQHLWRKSYAYEPSARIPVLMRWPKGLVSAPRNAVRSEPVEIRDILPTFLDAAQAPLPNVPIDGHSLLALMRGTNWRPYIDLEHDVCYSPANHWNALTDGRTKYIFHARDGEEQLFDLTQDPHELTDLASEPAHNPALTQWRERLVNHLSIRGDRFVKNGRLTLRPESYLYSPNYPKTSG